MSDLEKHVKRLERMLAVSRELTSTIALEPLLKRIVATAAELTDSEGASILLWDQRTRELRFRAAAGDSTDRLADIPVPLEGSIAGTVLTSGEPLIVSDAQSDPRHYNEVGQQVNFRTRSLLAVPMQIKERRIGVLEAVNKNGGFVAEDVETLTVLAAQAAIAIENANLVAALREAYSRLEELDRLKSDFISIASHELRTPLGLVLGYASMLREQLGDSAGPQMDAVLRAAWRLRRLIETMLNLRYLETGEVELKCTMTDLCREIQEACGGYRALADVKSLALEFQAPGEQLLACIDPDKFRLILDNLLSNAIEFTPPGGRVWVLARGLGQQVEVTVNDTGVGIPEDALERIFERFEQVEDHMTRQHEGMGLGLAIVKGLVELHGGWVWAESKPGQGSRFTVVLPVEQPEA